MSLIDKFYTQYDLIISLMVQSKKKIMNIENLHIEYQDDDFYIITFSHQKFDGMALLLLFSNNSISASNDCHFDFLLINFFSHYYNLRHNAYLNTPNNKLSYENLTVSNILLKKIYSKFKKGKFSSFLCALYVFIYFQFTNCDFCKIQIIHYIPQIEGVNKTFSDILIIPTKNTTIFNIYNYIEKNRKSTTHIYHIYKKYNFLSRFASKFNPTLFDLTFSNMSIPIQISNIQFKFKSIQFEKSYININCNDKDIFFSFVHDSSLDGFSVKFKNYINTLA